MVPMPTFSIVPSQVEARQFQGVDSPSFADIQGWCGSHPEEHSDWAFERADAVWTEPYGGIEALLWNSQRLAWSPLVVGDWVVRESDGRFGVVAAAEFSSLYTAT